MFKNSAKTKLLPVVILGIWLATPESRAAGTGFEFGATGEPVCAQVCEPGPGSDCTNPCLEAARAERKFRENSVYSHPGRIEFQPISRKGGPLGLNISAGSTSLCTQTNAALTHALIDHASRRIIVRFAHGERGDYCPALFVEREIGVQLAVIPGETGDYDVVSETPSTATGQGGVRSHGKVRIQE